MAKQRIAKERKAEIVKKVLDGTLSQGNAAELCGVHKSTIQGWLHIYQTFGTEGFVSQEISQRFTKRKKEAAVKAYLQGEGSLADISRRYGIRTKSTLLKWVEAYNQHIEFRAPCTHGVHRSEVYMSKGKATTQKERIEMVEYCMDHAMDYALVVEKYGVSYSQIYSWVKKFKAQGISGLEDRRGKKRLVPNLSELEQLREENRLLKKENRRMELENMLLKKCRALERGRH